MILFYFLLQLRNIRHHFLSTLIIVFMEPKMRNLELFLKDHVTLKTVVMMLKIKLS